MGRDIVLDVAIVACRSRQGRHLTVYNPLKTSGKYPFRLYLAWCSTTWITVKYQLHCNNSNIDDRLEGVVWHEAAHVLEGKRSKVSKVRQHVLEVVRLFFRIMQSCQHGQLYVRAAASAQLLQELSLKDLYGGGAVRTISKNFPSILS